jgi:drug/metabolite transporter (DMT)-like permease
LTAGILAALGAGMLWGFVFIAPVIAKEHSPWMLALARYTVFGIASLVIYWIFVPAAQKRALRTDKDAWWSAFWLALVGNLIYYVFLSLGIQQIGVPLVSLVIGTLPIVISICANVRERSVRWATLVLPLALIALGFVFAHEGETSSQHIPSTQWWLGLFGAIGALIAWTIYPIYNAAFIKRRSDVGMMPWACLQGIALLPLTASLLALTHFFGPVQHRIDAGDVSRLLFAASVAGIFSSWLGTWFWNIASEKLPAALTGQLIVFETVFSLLYGFVLAGRWPAASTWIGVACLLAGVIVGVRAFQREKSRSAAS